MPSTQSPTLVHHLNDYAPSGLEFAEIRSRFWQHLQAPESVLMHDTAIPPLDTMGLGFVTGQLALAESQHLVVIYGNCAPRRTTDKASKNNVDHGIQYVKLANGAQIINVYSEYAFGFVKSEIVEYRAVNCPAEGSQFRSRDFFPKAVADVINGNHDAVLGQELSVADIPAIPHDEVAWTDGFGNVKTTMRMSDLDAMGLKPGQKVQVILNGVSMLGVISIGGFQVDRGVLAINAGSSGYDDPFIELFLRVHQMSEQTAAVRFRYPVGGTKFEIKPL